MATNPAYNFGSYDSHGTGAYRYDPQNDAQANGRHRQNFFDNSEQRFMTARFADVTPFLAFDCVPGDRHTFKTNMRLRSYTLASPLMSTLTMSKDYYAVPLSSIIPNAFEKFYANPIKGDDVPETSYTFGSVPFREILTFISDFSLPEDASSAQISTRNFIDGLTLFSLLLNICSSGSLLSSLGCHCQNYMLKYVPRHYNIRTISGSGRVSRSGYDYYFQTLDEFIDNNRFGITFDSAIVPDSNTSFKTVYNLTVKCIKLQYLAGSMYGSRYVTYDLVSPSGFRKFLDDMLSQFSYISTVIYPVISVSYADTPDGEVVSSDISSMLGWYYLFPLDKFYGINDPSGVVKNSYDIFRGNFSATFVSNSEINNENKWFFAPADASRVDLSYLVAYHQIMSQFFSVDAIDNIYTSKMWMENMFSLSVSYNTNQNFSYNGTLIPYDIFSNHAYSRILSNISPSKINTGAFTFLINLFCFENSLSYGDYFNGGRLEPLAVGDVNITGTGTSSSDNVTVNALDVTRNLQFQRFLNKVNRTGAAIWDYIRGIQGHIPVQIDPMPRFIAHESCVISGFEVENTTAGDFSNPTTQQGYPVTMLNSGESRFAFDIEVGGDPCVVLGLMSFDMRRAYSSTVDRAFFKRDRFDFFQPDLQNVGDQALYFGELSPCYPKFSGFLAEYPFAYHLRDTHYKQRYPVAFGGFARQDILPSWANVIDFANFDYVGDGLNSEMIRNHNSDFDKFYQSLNGVTLSSYFHFIISIDNQLGSYREMQVKPLIAG